MTMTTTTTNETAEVAAKEIAKKQTRARKAPAKQPAKAAPVKAAAKAPAKAPAKAAAPKANPNRKTQNGTNLRRCTYTGHDGERWLPETTENFAFNSKKSIFNSWCKDCVRSQRQSAKAAKAEAE
ncbi:MAG TPA: hypothetical protein VIG48_03685 [Jatrophihabitans sp.]|jgi:uncharacterized membrane protein